MNRRSNAVRMSTTFLARLSRGRSTLGLHIPAGPCQIRWPSAAETCTYVFKDLVCDPQGFNLGGEVLEILKVRTENSRPRCDQVRRFFGADVRKPGALPIGDEGKGLNGALRCRHIEEGWDVAFPDHFPHPQDFGLSIDRMRRDAQGKSMTLAAHIQRGHESGPGLRPATDLNLQAKATMKAGQCSRPEFHDVDGRIPHQRSVGEYPQIASQPPSEGLASRGLPLLMGAPPVVSIPSRLRTPIPIVESLARDAKGRFLRI